MVFDYQNIALQISTLQDPKSPRNLRPQKIHLTLKDTCTMTKPLEASGP